MDKFDAVIIGSGIGGLTCGALLAKRGVRVAIFEKEKEPGGYCSSFSQNGYTFDACIDSMGCLKEGGALRKILGELRVLDEIELIKLSPIRRNLFPDLVIDIRPDPEQYQNDLKSLFPRQKDGISKVFEAMNNIYELSSDSVSSDTAGFDLQFWVGRTFKSLLDGYIDDDRLQAILSSYCNFLGLSASEVSAIAASNILMHYLKDGAFRIKGGMQNLINALVEKIQINGGKIYLGEGINEIVCNNGTANGVKTNKDREFKADYIVSGIDIKTVVNSMIKAPSLDKQKVKRINDLRNSGSFVVVYLGLDYDLASYNLVSSMGYFSSFNLGAMLNRDSELSFGISIPSLIDKSAAPKGCSGIVIHWPFCYNSDNTKPDKDLIADLLIDQIKKLVPDIQEHIVYKSVADSETFFRYTGNSQGAAYGWEQNTDLFSNLPFLRSIMGNFFIVGHWAGYGGGIMPSMLSAVRVSKIIVGER